jgi:hypothetical protein
MDLYKRGNENLQNAKKESQEFHSGKNVALPSVIEP